ncbi:MAG TPA: hypothetical protein VEI74_11130 [Candidatus Methylomirabilis sp.]|nr:hypothetical protein [Candidatus Methylomirabilis sp.]
MNKAFKKLLWIGLSVIGVTANQGALADQATCNTAGCTTANLPVNFTIVIPTVLRLQVGAVGAAAAVNWNAAVTAANLGNGTALNADAVTNGGAAGTLVAYALVSNISANNATITATGVGAGLVSGGNTIPYTAIGATVNPIIGAAVALPVPGTPTVVAPAAGVILRTGTWQYTYANAAVFPAGSYTGTINYTATQP